LVALLQPVPKVSAAETDPIRKSGKRVVQLGVIAPDTVDEVWSGLVGLCLQLPLQRCSATEAHKPNVLPLTVLVSTGVCAISVRLA
jgi:hypothetical protein